MSSNSTEPAAGPPPTGQPSPPWANLLLAVLSTAVLFLVLEGVASVLMSARAAKRTLYMREESHSQYDADLGWSHRPGLRIEDMYGEKARFTTNTRAFRATEDFDQPVPPGRYRLVALGDSFTMGYGVGDESTYPAQMQAQCPVLQTVNMGQGGYGLDQDYLWYKRDGVKLDANVLLVAVIAQDFFRMAGDNFIGYGKPVLRPKDGALAVENVPVPSTWGSRTPLRRAREFLDTLALMRTGRWLAGHVTAPPPEQFYGAVSAEVMTAATLALDDLARLSKQRGQHLVVAYLPVSDLLAKEPTAEAAWLEAYSKRSGVVFVNLATEFARRAPAEISRLFRPDYHYSEEGNRFVAATLLRHLGEKVPGFPGCSDRQTAPAASQGAAKR